MGMRPGFGTGGGQVPMMHGGGGYTGPMHGHASATETLLMDYVSQKTL